MTKNLIRSLGVVVLALALSGCWLQLGGGPGNTRFNSGDRDLTSDEIASLAVEWRVADDSFITEPVVSGGRIHVGNWAQGDSSYGTPDILAVRTYDSATGALRWETSLLPPNASDESSFHIETPALAGGALWVPYWHSELAPCTGRLARLDPETGAILSSDVTGTSSPTVAAGDSVAYMESPCSGANVRLVVRDQATRAIRWTYTFPAGSSVATPTIADGRLVVLSRDSLYAFDADGCGASTCTPEWTEAVDSASFDFLRIVAAPGGNLVTIGQSSDPEAGATLVVRDAATGDVRWEADPHYRGQLPGAITGMAVAYDTIYVSGTTRDDQDPPVGEAILDAYPLGGCGQPVCSPDWTVGFGPTRPAREPTVAGGVVYVPLVAGDTTPPAMAVAGAHGCGASRCDELTRVPFSSNVGTRDAQPYATAVDGGRVLVGWLTGQHPGSPSELISLAPAAP